VIISKAASEDQANKNLKYEIVIGAEHMDIVDKSVEHTVLRQFIERDDVNQESITSALQALNVPRPANEDLDYLKVC
jgi:hypothetical protein